MTSDAFGCSHTVSVQVCEHLQRVGKVCGVWAVPIVGGISPLKQERLLKKLPEVSDGAGD